MVECAKGQRTSKIEDFSSLEKLRTYGFRGEALHSMCAEGDVTITSKRDGEKEERIATYDQAGVQLKRVKHMLGV